MENKPNKFIAVSYKLYIDGTKGRELVEEATAAQPFQFVSGFGFALDAFESQLLNLSKDDTFQFDLVKEQAYGDYMEERVLQLGRDMFCIDGQFDHKHVYPDAIIPMQNEDGNRFYGRVLEIGADKVKVDLNHPLAGETLHFEGNVLENRDATTEEINSIIARMSGGCGGCGGGDCGEGCEGGCKGKGGCGGCH